MARLDTPGADLVSKQALIEGIRAHAQRILEREVRGEGREPLPQGLCALMLHNLLPAVNDACSIAERHWQLRQYNLLAATSEEEQAGTRELEEGQVAQQCQASQLLCWGRFSAGMDEWMKIENCELHALAVTSILFGIVELQPSLDGIYRL